jgi:DNA modification methylase
MNTIIQGDCTTVLKTLDSDSVDCVVTSPPYWALRKYGDHTNELGAEATCSEYVTKLVACFDEIKRVLKPAGTCWVNLGDTYSQGKTVNNRNGTSTSKTGRGKNPNFTLKTENKIRQKSLCCVPDRFKIAMVDNGGWLCRNDIIWYKRNSMPQSVKDRFTVDYERIFFFTKSSRYYYQQQMEAYKAPETKRTAVNGQGNGELASGVQFGNGDSLGRNVRCVWDIPTEPNHERHFAMYPERLVARMIKAGCPEGGTVLDPFTGAGSTLVCAKKLERRYIGIELYKKYLDIAENRLRCTTSLWTSDLDDMMIVNDDGDETTLFAEREAVKE